MKPPIFVRELSEKERESLEAGLRSRDTFVLRRCQILLASARGNSPPKIAESLGCASQTVRNAIRAFNEKGLDALIAGSSTPKRVYSAFDASSAQRLRGMLHRSPREFGYESSLWTLRMAAEAAFEEGLTEKRVSGETIRATLSRLLGIRWQRAKRWITSPDPLYERKKASFASDRLMETADADPLWAIGFLDECWWSRVALPTLSAFCEEGEPPRMIQQSVAKDDPDPKAISCYGLYLPRARRHMDKVRRRQARQFHKHAVSLVVLRGARKSWQEDPSSDLGQRKLAHLQGGEATSRQTQPRSKGERLWGEDRQLLSPEAESVAERHRAQMGSWQAQGRGVRRTAERV